MASRWLPGLRALTKIGRELRLIRQGVDRLADAAEGVPPAPIDLPEAPMEPMVVQHRDAPELARAYDIELRLADTLGRQPTEDEIIHELDGREHASR